MRVFFEVLVPVLVFLFWKRPNPVQFNSVSPVSFQPAELVTLTDLPTKNVIGLCLWHLLSGNWILKPFGKLFEKPFSKG